MPKHNRPALIFLLPKWPFPPFSGQAKHAFSIAASLEKKDITVYIIPLIFFFAPRPKYHPNPYHSIIPVCVGPISTLFIFCKLLVSFFIGSKPLEACVFDSPFIKRKLSSLLVDISIDHPNLFLHCFSLRTFPFWELISNLKSFFC